MSESKLLCLRCNGEEFEEDPDAIVVQLFHGMHLEIHSPVMVCKNCQWMALTGPQTDALIKKAHEMYDQITQGKPGPLKLDRVEEVGDEVKCDICCRDWTTSNVQGGFIYDNNAYCPDCCAEGSEMVKTIQDLTKAQYCPPDTSFADWIRQFRYATGQTQKKYFSGKMP